MDFKLADGRAILLAPILVRLPLRSVHDLPDKYGPVEPGRVYLNLSQHVEEVNGLRCKGRTAAERVCERDLLTELYEAVLSGRDNSRLGYCGKGVFSCCESRMEAGFYRLHAYVVNGENLGRNCTCEACTFRSIQIRSGFTRPPQTATYRAEIEAFERYLTNVLSESGVTVERPKGRVHQIRERVKSMLRENRDHRVSNGYLGECYESGTRTQVLQREIDDWSLCGRGIAREYHGRYRIFPKHELLPDGKASRTIHAIPPGPNLRVQGGLRGTEAEIFDKFISAKGLRSEVIARSYLYLAHSGFKWIAATDISAFDACISPDLRSVLTRVIRCVYPDIAEEDLGHYHGVCGRIHVEDSGGVHSGERLTSILATILVAGLQEYLIDVKGLDFVYFNCGDDNLIFYDDPAVKTAIIETFTAFGLITRVEQESTDYWRVKFLQSYYIEASDGKPTAIYDPIRGVERITTCEHDLTCKQGRLRYGARVIAYADNCSHIPILGTLANACLRCLGSDIIMAVKASNYLVDDIGFTRFPNREHPEFPDGAIRRWFHDMYGVAPERQLDVERLLQEQDVQLEEMGCYEI